jgi:chromosome segregation ATPase
MFGSLSSGGNSGAPADTGLAVATALLAIAGDPIAAKAHLDEIVAATAASNAARDEARAARDEADKRIAELAGLNTQQAKLIADREELEHARAVHQGAVAALADRERAVAKRETEVSKAAADLTSREQALADRLASYRQALA